MRLSLPNDGAPIPGSVRRYDVVDFSVVVEVEGLEGVKDEVSHVFIHVGF